MNNFGFYLIAVVIGLMVQYWMGRWILATTERRLWEIALLLARMAPPPTEARPLSAAMAPPSEMNRVFLYFMIFVVVVSGLIALIGYAARS